MILTIQVSTIKVMVLLWQFGIVDSLTLLQFYINYAAQYTGLTLGEAAGYMGDIGSGALLAPIKGLGISYQYIQGGGCSGKKYENCYRGCVSGDVRASNLD